jgi:hypothetical protein
MRGKSKLHCTTRPWSSEAIDTSSGSMGNRTRGEGSSGANGLKYSPAEVAPLTDHLTLDSAR